MKSRLLMLFVLAAMSFSSYAADAITGAVERQPLNIQAIVMFVIFVGATLYITYWASKRTRSRKDYYTAGGNITGLQMVWRWLVTLCLPHHFWGFQLWYIPQDTTD